MSIDGLDDETILRILTQTRRIALVGASPRAGRASNDVLRTLLSWEYEVTPVNPTAAGQDVYGRTVVAGLADAVPLEMVDIFRPSADVPPVVAEAIVLGARTIWMQLGIVNHEAADAARAAGLTVVMDRCPLIESRRLWLQTY